MECGQCRDCKWWWRGDSYDIGNCHMSTSYPDQKYGMISNLPGSLIAGISLGCEPDESKRVFKAIRGTNTDGVSMLTSRYFGCVMFEQCKD